MTKEQLWFVVMVSPKSVSEEIAKKAYDANNLIDGTDAYWQTVKKTIDEWYEDIYENGTREE